ncbi:MAG: WD40 repeat domain-containing protein, partial [Polyangiales bacterium]
MRSFLAQSSIVALSLIVASLACVPDPNVSVTSMGEPGSAPATTSGSSPATPALVVTTTDPAVTDVEGAGPGDGTMAPCAQAHELWARTPTLVLEGRLDRAARVFRRAEWLCTAEASTSRAAFARVLIDLGRYAEARKSIDALATDPAQLSRVVDLRTELSKLDRAATPADQTNASRLLTDAAAAESRGARKEALDKYLGAWDASHPNGPALASAGLLAKAMGDAVLARRLFDRAAVDYERTTEGPLELEVPNGFGGYVSSIVVGPHDTLIVAHRGLVSVLDRSTLKEKRRLRGHLQNVTAIATSPDRARIATSSRDGTIRIWDTENGRELLRLDKHSDSVESVAWSRDGRTIASASTDKTVRLWDATTGASLATMIGPDVVFTSVALSADGEHVIAGADDGVARVWEWRTSRLIGKLPGHEGGVTFVTVSTDGKVIATGGTDGAVRLWDATTDALKFRLDGHTASVTSLAFSPDGRRLASTSTDGTARVWDAVAGTTTKVLAGHELIASSVAFSTDGAMLMTGSYNTMHLWD